MKFNYQLSFLIIIKFEEKFNNSVQCYTIHKKFLSNLDIDDIDEKL